MKKASMQLALLAWAFFCLSDSASSQTPSKLNVASSITLRRFLIRQKKIVEILQQSNHPKAKSANPNDFIDMSLIKKLEEGGFFRRTSQR